MKNLQRKAKNRPVFERHVLLCAGKPDAGSGACCAREDGTKTWKYLGKRLMKLKTEGRHFYRTQTDCLMFCMGGPLMIVYPEGTWYRNVNIGVCELIIQQHLLLGKVVEEYAFHQNKLTAAGT